MKKKNDNELLFERLLRNMFLLLFSRRICFFYFDYFDINNVCEKIQKFLQKFIIVTIKIFRLELSKTK